MDDRYAALTDRLVEAVLTTPGATEPALRQAVAAHTAALSAGETPASIGLAPTLDRYLTTVAQRAYRTTEADITALQADGLADDAIFELTLAGALGAGQRRLARGRAALHGVATNPTASIAPGRSGPPSIPGGSTAEPAASVPAFASIVPSAYSALVEAGSPARVEQERETGGEVRSLRLAAVRTGYQLPARLVAAGFTDPPDIIKTLLYRPALFGNAFSPLLDAAMRGPSAWSVGERELFAAFVSRQNQCQF